MIFANTTPCSQSSSGTSPLTVVRSRTFKSVQLQVVSAMLLLIFCTSLTGQEKYDSLKTPVARIQWSKQIGVQRYRLQIASDERFSDVFFDGLITGYEYLARDLAPGRYYWRVAPSEYETGEFLKAEPFEVRAVVAKKPPLPVNAVARINGPGWLAATGEIARPIAAQLRSGLPPDFIGVNSEGTVYALDGSRGIALWTARFRLDAQLGEGERQYERQFVPLIIGSMTASSRVIVAFDKGVRALDGPTGRELWSCDLVSHAASGLVVNIGRNSEPHIYLIDKTLDTLFILAGNTGKVETQTKLRAEAIGPPVLLASEGSPGLLIPTKGGSIEVRKLDGDYVRSVEVGSDMTTPPVVVKTSRGELLLVGTKDGLTILDTAEFQSVARIAIGSDYPISLGVADLDDEQSPAAVMTTERGRVVAVDVAHEKIKWSADVANEATAAAFADLNEDGRLDVLLAGKNSFAVGLSGVDGSLIWQSSEARSAVKSQPCPRSLATAKMSDDRLIVVGTDISLAGLQAREITRAKSNAQTAKSNDQ
jgi:hypothetical protein